MAFGSISQSFDWSILLKVGLGAWLGSLICNVIYNVYFHPLAQFPGPKPWISTRITFIISLLRGNLVSDVKNLHESYGDIVRLAPNELSFAREDAWRDIFAHRPGHLPFPKNPIYFTPPLGQPNNIVTAIGEEDHARMRKLLDCSFTEKALKSQEPIIEAYVASLISHLKEKICTADARKHGGAIVNVVDWYHYTSFDIIGDLGFGEPFDCLRDEKLHPWIAMVFNYLKYMTLAAATRYYPRIDFVLQKFLLPKGLVQKADDHYHLALEKIHRRMSLEKQREDFMTPVLEQSKDAESLTMQEIESSFALLIIAGSETTGTTLSGITNYLIQMPAIFHKLSNEVRNAIISESDLTVTATRDLPYLNAVIHEGLRLCNPVPAGLPRVVPPGGDTVSGYRIPGGTHVSVHPTSISFSPAFFHNAESFVPERWLPLSERPSEYAADRLSAVRPFGVGPRSCIGKNVAWAEMRLILASLVWSFDIGMPAGEEWKPLDWRTLKTFIIVEKKPIWVRLRGR